MDETQSVGGSTTRRTIGRTTVRVDVGCQGVGRPRKLGGRATCRTKGLGSRCGDGRQPRANGFTPQASVGWGSGHIGEGRAGQARRRLDTVAVAGKGRDDEDARSWGCGLRLGGQAGLTDGGMSGRSSDGASDSCHGRLSRIAVGLRCGGGKISIASCFSRSYEKEARGAAGRHRAGRETR